MLILIAILLGIGVLVGILLVIFGFDEAEPGMLLLGLLMAFVCGICMVWSADSYDTGHWKVKCYSEQGYTEQLFYLEYSTYYTVEDNELEEVELHGICEKERVEIE